MKRILYVSVIAMLCFAMFSCTQDPVSTPNDIETVTPNEPEAVEPEVVEPEAVEPEVATIPFISEKKIVFGDTERILPAEDEDTKTIVVKFPEIVLGYTEPELVATEDFEWGDYRPFVQYMTLSYGELGSTPLYSYAVLGDGVNSIEDGNAVYEKLNEKYKRSIELTEELTSHFYPYEQSIVPFVLDSKIIYVSEDCSKIGIHYIEPGTFSQIYELYENGELVSTSSIPCNEQGYIYYSSFVSVYNQEGEYISPEDRLDIRGGEAGRILPQQRYFGDIYAGI